MRPLQLSLFGSSSPKAQAAAEGVRVDADRRPEGAPFRGPAAGEGRAPSLPRLVPPPPPKAQADLAARLSTLLREPASVELTDNVWTMVSYRRLAGRLHFRLHHMFQGAEDAVLRAVAQFTGKARKAAGHAIDEYIRRHRHLIKPKPGQSEPELTAKGSVHDLRDIYERLNADHFGGQVTARIGWGRRAPGRRRRSIKMGVYFHERKLIKLHPALDDARVPLFFVELVVFHEMLHQVVPPSLDAAGRRSVHGPAFRKAERAFPDYARARAWEKANLDLLLSKKQ